MIELGPLYEKLRSKLEGRVEQQLPLAPLTTYRLGGRAALYVEPAGPRDLELLSAAMGELDEVPVLPMGRGSNLLFSDHGYPGVVVRFAAPFGRLEGTAGRVVAGAGAALPQLSNWAARRGFAGIEFAIAIPGSVGGGVRMNAGAHGSDVSTVLRKARVFDLASGTEGELGLPELGFGYRHSGLDDGHIVLEATLELAPDEPATVKGRVESYRRHRADTQPPAVQNAGSVFKNPPGDHSGRLVEAAGLKGFSVGPAAVSELHANFFIARPGATAQDVFDLVGAVRRRVLESFGVTLEPEIRFVGEFDRAAE